MQSERLIRKYTNRRLYDTVASRHVTLEDLRKLIVAGEKLKVVDDKSNEDLTRAVLLQIISEQEQFGAPVLGSELLEMIIRFYGRPAQALLSRYLEQAFTTMLRQQEAMQVEMVKALQTPFAPLTDLARTNMELWEKMQAATRDVFMGRSPDGQAATDKNSSEATSNVKSPNSKSSNDQTPNDKEKGG